MEKYCYNCMNIKNNEGACEHCGKEEITSSFAHHLPPGTILNNRYMVGHVIGEGGFGITYIGRDLNLDMLVAVKEYYPTGYANRNNESSLEVTVSGQNHIDFYEKCKAKFIKEARVLAKFSGNKSIVDVRDYFEDNSTAYIVMEYVDGMTLKDYIGKNGRFEASDLFRRITPICEALKKVHNNNLIHRDISPDNIMIMKDGSLKLMDFGAARDVNFEDKKSLSIMLKPGYAPEEQYRSKGIQGPWTDIYAICATIYKCITGVTPDESMERAFSDELKRPSELGVEISSRLEDALIKGMAIYQKDRFQSIDEFLAAITPDETDETNTVTISSSKKDSAAESPSAEEEDELKTVFADDYVTKYDSAPSSEAAKKDSTERYDDEKPFVPAKKLEEQRKEEAIRQAKHEEAARARAQALAEKARSDYEKKVKAAQQSSKGLTNNSFDNAPQPQNKKKSNAKYTIIAVIAMAVIVIGVIIGFNTCSGGDVTVPDVTYADKEAAITQLEDAGLDNVIKYEYSDAIKKDEVISQSKESGTKVAKGTTIELVVSKGPSSSTVPNVIGNTEEKAISQIQEAGYTYSVKYQYSDEIHDGCVISQTPEANSTLESGSTVTIVVCQNY